MTELARKIGLIYEVDDFRNSPPWVYLGTYDCNRIWYIDRGMSMVGGRY